MRIAVTGAGGFIGSALCRYLAASDHKVLALSRDDLVEPDLNDCETVIHCAALAHRTGAERPDADEFDAINHRLAVRLALQARDAGVRRFIFVSTIYTIAGNESPLTVDMPLAPRDDYGASKAKAEAALLDIEGLEIIIARPVLVYGPGARANLRALARLCNSSVPLPFGRANNRRSMVSLENVVRALSFLAQAPTEFVEGKIFHLAEPDPRTMKDLIIEIRTAQGRAGRLLPVPVSLMKLVLKLMGKQTLFDQLYGDMIADTSTLIATGFEYSSGEQQLALMAEEVLTPKD